ncbi:hypothetical protein ACFY3U_07290 [Micromonospora sp. NPDC000089]|uniref:hypothetical protein n=1 Tax=unclassified Micromonospora TaxID=2617518 RepID=UPI0036BE7F1A
MVTMPAARRQHRSRIGYAFGLLVLVGAVTALVLVVRYPAESATRLAEPVPAPEITVVREGDTPPDDALAVDGTGGAGLETAPSADEAGTGGQAAQDGVTAAAGPTRPAPTQQTLSQSLFYSGLLGLAISLAGLGLVGTRRRMW